MEIASEVINHLRHQTRPVDRIDRANLVLAFEVQVVGHRLDDVLTVVKHTLDCDVVDVLVHQAEHLRLLKRAHAAIRRGHENAHAFFATHGVLGCAAGVAAGGAENIELFTAPRQLVLKQVTQQLHGHVFKGQCGPIRQGLQVQAGFKLSHRNDFRRAKNFLRIGFLANRFQVCSRNVVDVERQQFKSQIGVRQTTPGIQHGGRDLWVMVWQIQAAIRGQAFEQDVAEFAGRFVATGREVIHEGKKISAVRSPARLENR